MLSNTFLNQNHRCYPTGGDVIPQFSGYIKVKPKQQPGYDPISMQHIRKFARVMCFLAVASVGSAASAQGLVAYYQIGGDSMPWVRWDTYVIDSGSLVADGVYIRYKSFRVTAHGSDVPQEMKADCKTRQRSQVSDTSMYSTYNGTLGGEEVKVACALAESKGLVRK
jgi:hypothetical protein